jgi:hypothetical protein
MKYITVSIGNSDNKLTQVEWSEFVQEVHTAIKNIGKIHFFGGASNWEPWQNAAWIFEIENKFTNIFMAHLADIRKKYNQESAFFMCADGLFV